MVRDVWQRWVGPHQREIALLFGVLFSTFAMLSLLSYEASDPTWLHPGDGAVENVCGPLGALLADGLFALFGIGAYASFGCMVLCVLALAGRPTPSAWRLVAAAWLIASSLGLLALVTESWAGWLGVFQVRMLEHVAGRGGAWLAEIGMVLGAATLTFRIQWAPVFRLGLEQVERLAPRVGAGANRAMWATGALAGRGMRATGSAAGRGMHTAASASGRLAWSWADRSLRAARRMGRSLLRREGDYAPDEDFDPSSGLEPAGPPPESVFAERGPDTAVAGPDAVVEVEWEPTAATGAMLELFPALEPRSPTRAGERDTVPDFEDLPEDPEHTAEALAASADAGAPAEPVPAEALADAPDPSDAPDPVAALVPVPSQNRTPPSAQPRKLVRVQASAYLNAPARESGKDTFPKRTPTRPDYEAPSLTLLDVVPPQQAIFDQEELRRMAERLADALDSFKVEAVISDITVGPVVTIFEVKPARGQKLARIESLGADLAMALRVESVRIAPRSEKGVVGVEVPSTTRLTIYLREIMGSPEFARALDKRLLPCVIGKDVEGKPVIEDLAAMPHVLIAGTTGSGKSVGVNGILLSLLYAKTPDELRLLLIDPKKLEFRLYEDIPHLLHPVVTEPRPAAAALAWACRQMDERYEEIGRWGVRDIVSYNDKVERTLKVWNPAAAEKYTPADWMGPEPYLPQKMPWIVIVIDELAELMYTARKEVEESVVRLAQKARACGIHLILATQRPSVDVVTGLIKANMPTRISFKLRVGVDSKTIIDSVGAESLLGKGDLLLLPNTGATDPVRCHGAFVSDAEVERVTEHLRAQGEPQYIDAVTDDAGAPAEVDLKDKDPLYEKAVAFVVAAGKASTSMVQREYSIGYNRAAKIVEYMEAMGVVGPADGARPREVLIGPVTTP